MKYKQEYLKLAKQQEYLFRYLLNRADLLAQDYDLTLRNFLLLRNPDTYDIFQLLESRLQLDFFEGMESDLTWILFKNLKVRK